MMSLLVRLDVRESSKRVADFSLSSTNQSTYVSSPTSALPSFTRTSVTAHAVSSEYPTNPLVVEETQPARDVQSPAANPQVPRVAEAGAWHQILRDLRLGMKLLLLVLILSQGDSKRQVVMFSVIAFILFLFQSGRLNVILERLPRVDLTASLQPATQVEATQRIYQGMKRAVLTFICFLLTVNPMWDPLINNAR